MKILTKIMENKGMAMALRALAIASLLTLGFAIPTSAAGETTVSISAPGGTLAPGQQFTVTIDVSPGTDIAGVQASFGYNASLVTVVSVTEGGLLTQGGASTYFNPAGIAGAITTPGASVSGAGAFAVITMVAGSQSGTSPLTLSGVVVGDVNGAPVSTIVYNGEVTVDANNAPSLGYIGNKMVAPNQNLTFTISGSDPDGDALTYSASGLPAGAAFDPATATFSWTPTTEGTYSGIHFEVSDGRLTDWENITIIVGVPNNTPVLNPIGSQNVNVGETVTFTISGSDPDGDALTYSASGLPAGAAFDPATATFSWTPTTEGTYNGIHFEVSDGSLTDWENITITVIEVVDPAVFSVSGLEIGPEQVYAGQDITVSVTVSNSGGSTGNYQVSLVIDGQVVLTKNANSIAAGESRVVTMTATMATAGTFTIDVNGLTATYVVNEVPPLQVSNVDTAAYYSESGQLAFTQVTYDLANLQWLDGEIQLVLKVSLNGVVIDEISLTLPAGQDGQAYGAYDYAPSSGWQLGNYAFTIELSGGEQTTSATSDKEITATSNMSLSAEASAPVVSWAVLGGIIGGTLIVAGGMSILILRSRRSY